MHLKASSWPLWKRCISNIISFSASAAAGGGSKADRYARNVARCASAMRTRAPHACDANCGCARGQCRERRPDAHAITATCMRVMIHGTPDGCKLCRTVRTPSAGPPARNLLALRRPKTVGRVQSTESSGRRYLGHFVGSPFKPGPNPHRHPGKCPLQRRTLVRRQPRAVPRRRRRPGRRPCGSCSACRCPRSQVRQPGKQLPRRLPRLRAAVLAGAPKVKPASRQPEATGRTERMGTRRHAPRRITARRKKGQRPFMSLSREFTKKDRSAGRSTQVRIRSESNIGTVGRRAGLKPLSLGPHLGLVPAPRGLPSPRGPAGQDPPNQPLAADDGVEVPLHQRRHRPRARRLPDGRRGGVAVRVGLGGKGGGSARADRR